MIKHPDWRSCSLRRRLLVLVTIASLLIWLVAGITGYRQARSDVQELMDGQMAQTAALLMSHADKASEMGTDFQAEAIKLRGIHKSRLKWQLEYAIFAADGRVRARSRHGPEEMPADAYGYLNIFHQGQPWRSLQVASAQGDYRVWVAQSMHSRDREALEIASKTVLPLGLFFPVLVGLIYFSVRRSLKPLEDVAGEVAMRSVENLDPVAVTRVPVEVEPLVSALNHLLHRLRHAIDHERRFTADAAHELRTPLAAIRIQAQVALASTDPGQHRHALHQVLAGTQRATRLVEQLLHLARLDPIARLSDPHDVDLAKLATSLHAEMSAVFADRAADLALAADPVPVVIAGDSDLLTVAMRNLAENALKHTRPGCKVTLFAKHDQDRMVCGVCDAGEGVPAEELPRLTERFYRGRDNTTEGSGLGLAIVQRIAELNNARFEIKKLAAGGIVASLAWIAVNCGNRR